MTERDPYRERAETILMGFNPRKRAQLIRHLRSDKALHELETRYKGAYDAINAAAEDKQESLVIRSARPKSLAMLICACGLPAEVKSRWNVHVDIRPLLQEEQS